MTFRYSGPSTGTVDIAACPSCTTQLPLLPTLFGPTCGAADSPRVTLTLPPGTYAVLLRNQKSTGTPYVATWPPTSGTTYGTCFYTSSVG